MSLIAYAHGSSWLLYRVVALAVHPGWWTIVALGFSLTMFVRSRSRRRG